jgi:hypothetical protein
MTVVTIKEATDLLATELKIDEGYRRTWQANIAMAFKDEWQRSANDGGLPCTPEHVHEIANKAATYFLSLLCSEKDKPFVMLKDLYEKPKQAEAIE